MSIIIADIGASNARFAILKKGKISDSYQFSCDDFKSPETLISLFKNVYAPNATSLLIGAAGVVVKNKVHWTNRAWQLDGDKLKKKLALKYVLLKNDVEVQCMALARLKTNDFKVLQKGNVLSGPKVLLSIGTGVGAAYLLNNTVFATEYGQTIVEKNLVLEKTLSHLPANKTSVFAKNHQRQGATCQKFYQHLAHIVMNMILTLKATGGVYMYGSMLDEKMLQQEKFVAKVLNHPTMKCFLQTIPIVLIKRQNLAFMGLKELARKSGLS